MENKIGKNFDSLAQRIIYSYAGTFPRFVPVESDMVTENSQEQMYNFMESIIQKLYNNPELIGLSIDPDDCYMDFELQNKKPELIDAMRKCKKKIDDFFMLLLRLGELGTLRDNKLCVEKNHMKIMGKTLIKLKSLGLNSENSNGEIIFWSDEYSEMIPAWKLLVTKALESNKDSLLLFSHCMFDTEYTYTSHIFESLLDNKAAFKTLENFFKENEYKAVEMRENEISLDWIKKYGKNDEPLKASWAERVHGGISIYYDYRKKNQIVFGLRIPKYKELLMHFNEMDNQLKDLVIRKTKECDGCGYCTQTDKTGVRKPQFFTAVHRGEHNLCQLFPGFSYIWTYLDDNIVSDMIKLLSFIDMIFS